MHGDILVPQIQRAVIDTDIFQRLRFIRQTGLLHYVFPGAIHTRFAHSLGTMHIAQKIFKQLFPRYSPGSVHDDVKGDKYLISLNYIGIAFEVAALCHDLGHCAFSHSIENIEGKIIFESIDSYVGKWKNKKLSAWWAKIKPEAKKYISDQKEVNESYRDFSEAIKHEELGILFLIMMFSESEGSSVLEETCKYILGNINISEFWGDIICLMRGESWLKSSDYFKKQLEIIVANINPNEELSGRIKATAISSLEDILHGFISGTLDADRFDYLLRDSLYTGTPCGKFDLELLIGGFALRLLPDKHIPLILCIHERSSKCVDDFLWSRFQLYEQIILNKTNVILNKLFSKAIFEMAGNAILLPVTYEQFLEFTDDRIMSDVRSQLIKHRRPSRDTLAWLEDVASAFSRKKLPKHLHSIKIHDRGNSSAAGNLIAEEKKRLAKEMNVDVERILHGVAETTLINSDQTLPQVISHRITAGGEISEEIKLPSYFMTELISEGRESVSRMTVLFFYDQSKDEND